MDDRDDAADADLLLSQAHPANRRAVFAAAAGALIAALGAGTTDARKRKRGKHRTRNNNKSDATSIGQGGPGGAGGPGGNVPVKCPFPPIC